MKTTNKIKNYLKIGLYLFLTTFFFNCQNEDFSIEEKHDLEHKNYNISFLEFKNETNIKNFKPILKTKISNKKYLNKNNTLDESNFLTDTTNIKRFENPENNKITYSFKIYPLNNTINDKEYYNLVYEKDGDNWSEMIFFNTDEIKEGSSSLTLKTSEVVYSSRGSGGNWSEVITITIRCNGSCNGPCDGFACSTGECLHTSVSYIYVGSGNDGGGIDETIDAGSNGNGGGGGNSSSIYVPNPYTAGIDDLNNPLYILASEVSTYTNSLPQNLQTIIASESWFFPAIFNYFKDNNGVRNTTKANVTNALNDYNNLVADFNIRNVRARERFKYWAFNFFLNNNMNSQTVLDIKNYLLSENSSGSREAVTDFLYDNLNSQEAVVKLNDIIEMASTSENTIEARKATKMTLNVLERTLDNNFYDTDYFNSINQFTEVDLTDPILIQLWRIHFSIKCASIKNENPNWSKWKVYWEASKEMIHTGLDIAGLAPVVGIVFDVANAVIYVAEGDGVNATLSGLGAIPVVGQWVTAAKFARKTVLLTNGRRVYLRVYNLVNNTIKFSRRGQLRKVLGITDITIHAHHIIPYSLGVLKNGIVAPAQELIQMAAKYTDGIPGGNGVWHINDIANGIPMQDTLHLIGHTEYLNAIKSKLIELKNLINSNNFAQAFELLTDFMNALKTKMTQNPNWNSGQFVDFINNYTP